MELLLLKDADLLDETGAMDILWDSMAEGACDTQSFYKTYKRIKPLQDKYNTNPMHTHKARDIWDSKSKLVNDFIKHLEDDLNV